MCSGPTAKTQPEPFHGIETVEGARRTYFERPGLLIAGQQQCTPVHQPPVRFHMLQTVDIGIYLGLRTAKSVMPRIDPKAIAMTFRAIRHHQRCALENTVRD